MLFIHLSALFGIFVLAFCFCGANARQCAVPKYRLIVLLLAACALRLAAAALSKGFGSDTACFAAWADRIFQVGPENFYSPDVFTDYPPGYMYVLWLSGALRSWLSIGYYSSDHLILLKLPSMICDILCGWLIFREAARKWSENQAFFLCLAYLFNPAVFLNSSVWGQVDSVYTLAVVYMCLCLIRRKMYPAYIAFGMGVLIKPQMLLFAPVLLAGGIDSMPEKNLSAFLRNLSQILSVALGMVILCLPFGLGNVWEQYFSTVSSYPYAAVNACNLWGLLGLNWVSQANTFLGIPYQAFGGAAIALAVLLALFLSLRCRRDREKYPFLGALLVITIYMFSVRMHERYLYPGLLLLLFAYLYKPSRLTYLCYGGFSILHFYNTANVLFFYDPANYDRKAPIILVVSAGMLVCTGLLFYAAYLYYRGVDAPQIMWTPVFPERPPQASRRGKALKISDFFCMLSITLIYSAFALYDLGDRTAPITTYDMVQNQSIELDFGQEIPAALSYYIAPWDHRIFTLEGKRDASGDWISMKDITLANVFTWQEVSIETEGSPETELSAGTGISAETGFSKLRLTLQDTQASLLEFTFLDGEGNVIAPINAQDYPALFDETSMLPKTKTFRNSMYFDEIYHARTAYEFLNGLTSYENTHPPLGKIFISLGIAVFGMNPFGWRIIGTLFGIAMVPLVYLFARRLSGSALCASMGCMLFSFDFMHFTQTRIATIDVYITFFVMLMYYFMYQYSQMSFYDTDLRKTWAPLGACGVSMGFGIACKWTGMYAGAGLALIFFSVLYRRYREYLYAKKEPSGTSGGISHSHVIRTFHSGARRTVLFCLVFFVAVPALIYLLSYLPFRDYSGRDLISRMLYNQKTMFQYHSNLEATHAYSSAWYEWPIIRRPIWYYSRVVTKTASGGLREGISAFGNPAVWWLGIPALFYMIWLWAKRKDRNAAFLVVGYFAQYLPWFFVTRITFIYHYFPSVVFVALMLMYSFVQWKKRLTGSTFLASMALYCGIVFLLFLMFYPVLSGQPVEAAYVNKYLRWFRSWVLTLR